MAYHHPDLEGADEGGRLAQTTPNGGLGEDQRILDENESQEIRVTILAFAAPARFGSRLPSRPTRRCRWWRAPNLSHRAGVPGRSRDMVRAIFGDTPQPRAGAQRYGRAKRSKSPSSGDGLRVDPRADGPTGLLVQIAQRDRHG